MSDFQDHDRQTVSYWNATKNTVTHSPLTEDLVVDVAIVGGGIAGLSCAYRLIKLGKTVAVLEDGSLGSGQTSRTSAHLASYVDGRLFDLIRLFGVEKTRLIVESHQAAIDEIENIVAEEEIDCDFKRVSGYLFSERAKDPWIAREIEALKELGNFPFVETNKAPFTSFESARCIRFPNQAQFHPLNYLYGLDRAFIKYGGKVFEETHVTAIHDATPCILSTSTGAKVTATHVIVATHSPINDRLVMHTKQAQYQTYVIGALVPKTDLEEALYWDTCDPYHYLRTVAVENSTRTLLIVGGEDHRTGQKSDPKRALLALKKWTEKRFLVHDIIYEWSGQVVEPIDGVAFIGKNPLNTNIFIHTSAAGNGLTYAQIAAAVIPDLIINNTSRYEEIYSPRRRTFKAINEYVAENSNSFAQYADWFKSPTPCKTRLAPNDGCVERHGLAHHAVYKDNDGAVHRFSAVCPHLGGIVRFNELEKTWDCPCHGSRFNARGEVIAGPANQNLTKIENDD